jgi:hypothetical protein
MCLRTLDSHLPFNLDYHHHHRHCRKTRSTQYRCTHYTLLLTTWYFQSVCSSVSLWSVTLATHISPLVHLVVNIPPAPQQSSHSTAGISRGLWTVFTHEPTPCHNPEEHRNWTQFIYIYIYIYIYTHIHIQQNSNCAIHNSDTNILKWLVFWKLKELRRTSNRTSIISTALQVRIFGFFTKTVPLKVIHLWRSVSTHNFMEPCWLVQVFHSPQKFEACHFGIVKAAGIKVWRRGHLNWHDYLTEFNKILLTGSKIIRGDRRT